MVKKDKPEEPKGEKEVEKELAKKIVTAKPVSAKPSPKSTGQNQLAGKKSGLKSRFWLKDIILGVLNLVFVVSLVVLLGRLPGKANEFKRLRNESLDTAAKSSIEIAGLELEASRKKADKISAFFPDDAGLIDFVNQIDVLKEEGLVSRFSFTSEEAIRDRTGYYGIPVFIEFSGTWSQVGVGLQRVQNLPYLLRAVSIETTVKPEENLVEFKYGGFLYVDESFAKNR
jgi:hypothetical protein